MPKQKKKAKAKKSKKAVHSKKRAVSKTAPTPAPNNAKTAIVTELLERTNGVSIAELVAKTGWQPHTCRAKISVLGKSIAIEKSKNKDGDLVYRKVAGPDHTASKR